MSHRKRTNASPPAPPSSSTGSLHPGPAEDEEVAPADVAPADVTSDDAASDDPGDEHAVESLARSYGATDAEVDALVGAIPAEAIVADGERCATVRACDEVAAVADAAQQLFARGGSPAASLRMGEVVVRVMVTCAARAAAAHRDDACARVERKATAPVATRSQSGGLKRARAGMWQIANALRGVCAGDAAAQERIRLAECPGETGHVDAGPGRALASLAEIGREFLGDPARATQAEAWGITPAWLDALEATAATARRATSAREAPAPAAVDTAAQRRWRGLTVILLRRVFGAFASGHAVDPEVPKLTPRYLRKVLMRKGTPKKAAAKKAAPPATPPAAPAPTA